MTFLTGAELDEVRPLVERYHYSGRMPVNVRYCYAVRASGGLFGDYGEIIAASAFFTPPTKWAEEILELGRLVRTPECTVPLTQLLSFSCARLVGHGHALVVSFADWTHNHHGGVYQAAGWRYGGVRGRAVDGVLIDGTFKPGRSCNSVFGTRSPRKLQEMFPARDIAPHFDEGKHLYWKPLTVAGKTRAKRMGLLSLSYPKPNAVGPVDVSGTPRREAGATPADRSNLSLAPAAA